MKRISLLLLIMMLLSLFVIESSSAKPKPKKTCQGKKAQIVNQKVFVGKSKQEVLFVVKKSAIIYSKGGADLICLSSGENKVVSGPGNDKIEGGSGRDQLEGGPGNDRLKGGNGPDKILGQAGKDTIFGQAGIDNCPDKERGEKVICEKPLPNEAPQANDDFAETNEDKEITIQVLANDSDPDNEQIDISNLNIGETVGFVNYSENGRSFVYDPTPLQYLKAGEEFIDSFTYQIKDARGKTSQAKVTITVSGRSDNPEATPDNADAVEDTQLLVPVLDNDTDPDGGLLEIVSLEQPLHGSAVLDNDQVRYLPNQDYCGEDSFYYELNGGSRAQVFVTVECTPDAPLLSDDSVQVLENESIQINPLVNDEDADFPYTSEELRIVFIDTSSLQGNATISEDQKSITYDSSSYPELGQGELAAETLVYTVEDNDGLQSQATIYITIEGI